MIKKEIKIYWPFYAQTLILNLAKVIMPFWVLYFLHIGLNFFQIALISTARSIVFLIMEIPTGALADIIGRKKIVILGYFLTAITYFLIPFFHNFWPIIGIFVINAFCETLFSQSDQAWAIDISDNNFLNQSYLFRMRVFRNIGMIVAPILGGFIVARYGMAYLWPVFGIGVLISTICLFFAKENKIQKPTHQINIKKEMKAQIKNVINFLTGNFALKIIFGAILLFTLVEEITSLVWTPYLQSLGVDAKFLGVIFSVISAIGIILPNVANVFIKDKHKKFTMIALALFYSLLLFGAGLIGTQWLIVAIFIIFSSLDEVFLPLEEVITNEQIPNHHRASVLSAKSTVTSLAGIIGGLIAGIIADHFSNAYTLIISGVILLILPVLYWIFFRSKKRLE